MICFVWSIRSKFCPAILLPSDWWTTSLAFSLGVEILLHRIIHGGVILKLHVWTRVCPVRRQDKKVHNIQRHSFCHEVSPVNLCIHLKAGAPARYVISLPPRSGSTLYLQGSQAVAIKNLFANRLVCSLSQERKDFSCMGYFEILDVKCRVLRQWHFGTRDSIVKIQFTAATSGNAITNQKHCLLAIIVQLYWEGWTLTWQ